MSRTIAIVQARQTSSRLPGKALLDLGGRPVLERVVERLQMVRNIDGFVVAVPGNAKNLDLSMLAHEREWLWWIGDEQDVLGRYVGAANYHGAETIVRVTADCPLLDPGVIEGVVNLFRSGEHDFVSNNLEKSFPHGLDVECFSRAALIAADESTQDAYEREHVTLFMIRHPEIFRQANLKAEVDLSELRFTLDYPADLDFLRALFLSLKPGFTTADVLWIMERRPDLQELHARAKRVAEGH